MRSEKLVDVKMLYFVFGRIGMAAADARTHDLTNLLGQLKCFFAPLLAGLASQHVVPHTRCFAAAVALRGDLLLQLDCLLIAIHVSEGMVGSSAWRTNSSSNSSCDTRATASIREPGSVSLTTQSRDLHCVFVTAP